MIMKIPVRYHSCFQGQEKAPQLRISVKSESSDHMKETKQNQGGGIFG